MAPKLAFGILIVTLAVSPDVVALVGTDAVATLGW
jgi:hypothetical protein